METVIVEMYMLTIISFYILRVRLTFQSSNSPHVRLFCACSEVRTFLKLINFVESKFFLLFILVPRLLIADLSVRNGCVCVFGRCWYSTSYKLYRAAISD